MLETVDSINTKYHDILVAVEWMVTVLFTLEYIARIVSVKRPLRYIFSFYGIVDLLSIIPTYLAVIVTGTQALAVIRGLRLLRIFRVLKLGRYTVESNRLREAFAASRVKITVFLMAIGMIVIIIGSLMYLIEGAEAGFDSIPKGVYWAIVTLTTVGYGDITPVTPLGQFLSALIMILGYSIIAVPTGLVTASLVNAQKPIPLNTQHCPNCSNADHADDAHYCKYCGEDLFPHHNID